jgi:hypothetical protein
VVAEMLMRKPLFAGRDYADQLVKILAIIGKPSPEVRKECQRRICLIVVVFFFFCFLVSDHCAHSGSQRARVCFVAAPVRAGGVGGADAGLESRLLGPGGRLSRLCARRSHERVGTVASASLCQARRGRRRAGNAPRLGGLEMERLEKNTFFWAGLMLLTCILKESEVSSVEDVEALLEEELHEAKMQRKARECEQK